MLYNVTLVSSVQQHESAVCIQDPLPLKPLSHTPIPDPGLSDHQAELPVLHGSFLPAVYFTQGGLLICMPGLLSQFIPPSPSLAASTTLFLTSASLFLPYR